MGRMGPTRLYNANEACRCRACAAAAQEMAALSLLSSRYLSPSIDFFVADVRFGSKADIRTAKSHVRFTP